MIPDEVFEAVMRGVHGRPLEADMRPDDVTPVVQAAIDVLTELAENGWVVVAAEGLSHGDRLATARVETREVRGGEFWVEMVDQGTGHVLGGATPLWWRRVGEPPCDG